MNWTQTEPKEQGSYWMWDGDEENAPVHIEVFWSGADNRCFVPAGQYGWTRAQSMDELEGHWWSSLEYPPLPTAPTTQPQAKGEFGEPRGHELWKHLHEEHGLTLLKSEIHEIVRLAAPLAHDLTKVAVVDKTVLEEVKSLLQRYERSMENCSANLDLPLQALAKLNTGGSHD